jgi:tetratricopeptide (TPR) repeat protein
MGKRSLARIGHLALSMAVLLSNALGTSESVLGQTRRVSRRGDPKAILAVADLYYKNNDISDKAAVEYRKVRDQFPSSKEAETAQYFLGSYYHRKFYIQRDKKLKEDYGLLVEAQGQYEDYVNRYAWRSRSPDWLADAHFNLALIFLQRGENQKGEAALGKMYGAAPYDPTTHVYQVIWSPNTKDVIDGRFDSKQLAEYANSLIYTHAYTQQRNPSGRTFEIIVEKIKLWCKGRKSLR